MSRRAFKILIAAAAAVFVGAATARAQTKLLRYPDIHGDKVVFTHAGDLWTAPAKGGMATRLTSHPGLELFAKFSPDGQWVAFTGQYDGDEQVYVVPATGGVPRQLTYYPARVSSAPRHGYDNLVYGWTRDGQQVLFRSLRDVDGIVNEGRLYTVPAKGGLARPLPPPTAGAADYSPDGRKLIYSPLFRDFRHWKRYQGGWAQDLYIYDLATNATEPVAPSVRTERDPMWLADGIYFVSDRDGILNLYRYDIASKAVEQITRNDTWDVRWAASDGDRQIVYELNGELHVYDASRKQDRAIAIDVPDDGVAARPSHYAVERFIEDFALSPKGERALFVARGDVFTAPIEHGPVRNLTGSSSAHDRAARWSPDGKSIAIVSDRSGEEQIHVLPQDGYGKSEQVTKGLATLLNSPAWSPDSKRIAFSDSDGKVYVLTLTDKKLMEVACDERGEVRDYAWSPDSRFLAFSLSEANQNNALFIWSSEDGKTHRVSDGFFNEYAPAFDPSGKYLYFLSERNFAPLISAEWNFAITRQTGIFALALQKDGPSPFPPRSDEVKIGEEADKASAEKDKTKADDKSKGKDGEKKKEEIKPIKIDFEGLSARVTAVPIEAGNYDGFAVTADYLLYLRQGNNYYGRDSDAKTDLVIFDLKERKESVLVEDVTGYDVSADGKKALVRQERNYNLYDVNPKSKEKKAVSTKGLAVERVPAEEWAQIFDEVWRRYRSLFYAKNMHGYDWNALRERYRPWLKWVGHRADLNYVLTEMISELNVGHTYVEYGDFQTPERPQVGLPGARFELDATAGRYRIAKIFAGHNQEDRYRSPLSEVGVDAKVGDYVLAIDGQELLANDDPYRLLRHKTETVTLTVNAKPVLEGARKATYHPITSEANLLYLEQVNFNREKVARLTDGKAGYLHIPDMGAEGAYEFVKWFYPQIRKQGLVVDVRSNGGGNISQWIIERLSRKLLGTRFGRRPDAGTYPAVVFHGQKVCLLNETSASDGDIFPHMFRQAKLGPLVGKRSWGGVVGISGRGPLIDGGGVSVPLRGTNAPDGKWVIEGYGVEPDIPVENDPQSVNAGKDPQLERGVEELLKMMAAEPMTLPARPPDPVKTK